MSAIRFYIGKNRDVYLGGEVEFDVVHGTIHIILPEEDMEEFITKMEDIYAEVVYGGSDDVS